MLGRMRIVHLADLHLTSSPSTLTHGVNPYTHLAAAVAAIRKQVPAPDLVVLGGDLTEDGEHANYQALLDLFKDLKVPVHTVLGNHDSLNGFRKTAQPARGADFPGYYSFDLHGVHFVMLYSAGTGKEFGRLEEKQLLWLNEDLHRNAQKPVLVFLHHPPFDTGVAWLDKLGLANAEGFWEIIPPYSRNILGVFAAHLHLQHTCLRRGVLAASCPAVSFQFNGGADSPRGGLSEEPPGFNLIDLADGALALRTVRFCPPKAPAEAQAAETHRAETHHPGRPPAETARQA
jgi:3',5'-cyclic AMP phosphodiesterase CpdA